MALRRVLPEELVMGMLVVGSSKVDAVTMQPGAPQLS